MNREGPQVAFSPPGDLRPPRITRDVVPGLVEAREVDEVPAASEIAVHHGAMPALERRANVTRLTGSRPPRRSLRIGARRQR